MSILKILNSKFTRLAVLLVFLLGWFNSVSASIICHGQDGHIAIENARSGYCNNHQNLLNREDLENDQVSIISVYSNGSCHDELIMNGDLNLSDFKQKKHRVQNQTNDSSIASSVQHNQTNLFNTLHKPRFVSKYFTAKSKQLEALNTVILIL